MLQSLLRMFPATHLGLQAGSKTSNIQLEVFLDFICPFSKKAFLRLHNDVLPKYGDKVHWASRSCSLLWQISFRFQNVVQPWHHQGIFVHETAAVVKQLKPEAALSFYLSLFDSQEQFFDDKVDNLTKAQIYDMLASFAADKTGKHFPASKAWGKNDFVLTDAKFWHHDVQLNFIHFFVLCELPEAPSIISF